MPGQINLPEFIEWPKIPRLNRDITITEKIDGTNAQIYIDPNSGVIYAGSRTRWLDSSKGNDNFGFAAWVKKNEEVLRLLGPGRHYGEWWGQGIQRGYALDIRRFSLFDINRYFDLPYETREKLAAIYVVNVPLLYQGLYSATNINRALKALQKFGSFASLGFTKPEGIVIYHNASRQLFKITLENDEAPKTLNAA